MTPEHPIVTMVGEQMKAWMREVMKEAVAKPDQLLTLDAAAEQMQCDRSWLGKLVRRGELPSIRRGRNYVRVAQSDLDDLKRRWRNVRRVSHLKSA